MLWHSALYLCILNLLYHVHIVNHIQYAQHLPLWSITHRHSFIPFQVLAFEFPRIKKKKNPGSPNYVKPNLLPNKLNAKGQCTNVYAHKAKFHLQLHHCKNLPMYATAKDCKLWRRPHSPLRTFQTDLPLSETACKGNKETLFSAVANRVQIRVWEKQHQTSAVCPNYNPPVWRPSDNNDNNEAALAETSSDHARGWQRHPDQLCRHYAVLSSSPCKSYKIIEALSLTEFHYQVIVRLNVYTAIYIYCIYIIYILLLLVSSSCSY